MAAVRRTRALELRVHGVSGTPPEELLDRPLVTQIAGDGIAGFYAPRLREERTDAAPGPFAPRQPGAPRLVGYSWGGLTSGSAGRAFWLLLLPFTLVNLVPRARPATRPADSAGTFAIWYLSRLLALLLTLLFTLTGVGIGEDLIAWQCTGRSACARTMPSWVVHQDLALERMLLLGALVPAALLLAIWFVSARTANRYERTVADVSAYRTLRSPDTAADRDAVEVGLDSPLMWRNEAPVRRLRALHLQAGFAVVVWSLLAPTAGRWLGLAPAAVVAYALLVPALPGYTGHGTSTRWRAASVVVWAVLVGSGGTAVVGLLTDSLTVQTRYLCTAPVLSCREQHGLPFFDVAVFVDSALAVGVLVVLAVVVAVSRFGAAPAVTAPHQPLAQGMGGMVAAAFAALGVFLAAAFTSGSYVYVASLLHTGSLKPTFGEVSSIYRTFRVPPTVATATLAYTFAAAGLVVVAIAWAVGVAVANQKQRRARQFAADYPDADETTDPRRGTQIRRDMWLGTVVDHAPWLVGPLVLVGVGVVGVFGVQLAEHLHTPIERLFGTDVGWTSKNFLSGVGAYLVVLTLVGLVTLGALAFRVPATRRSVGILWDVASFWPRTCHPLAAPCYAERTVPDLVTFVTGQRIAEPDRAVVVSAHSQGTVIGAATIFQLAYYDELADARRTDVRVLPRLGLLTFGCVLRRLYGRYFPVYFGPDRLARLQAALHSHGPSDGLPRWRNLWRYTDYLGGQVTAGPPQAIPTVPVHVPDPTQAPTEPPATGPYAAWEWHAPDPPRFARDPGDTTYPAAHRHSDFWSDDSGFFQLAVRDLVRQIDGDGG